MLNEYKFISLKKPIVKKVSVCFILKIAYMNLHFRLNSFQYIHCIGVQVTNRYN